MYRIIVHEGVVGWMGIYVLKIWWADFGREMYCCFTVGGLVEGGMLAGMTDLGWMPSPANDCRGRLNDCRG